VGPHHWDTNWAIRHREIACREVILLDRIIVIGTLGRDPETGFTPTGETVASFSIVSNHVYRDKLGLKHTETSWFHCLAYGKLAETCTSHLKKGQRLVLEGMLQARTYQTVEVIGVHSVAQSSADGNQDGDAVVVGAPG
jgi:single stranded DNA-binding protein